MVKLSMHSFHVVIERKALPFRDFFTFHSTLEIEEQGKIFTHSGYQSSVEILFWEKGFSYL